MTSVPDTLVPATPPFNAVLRPHRSLSPAGFAALMVVIAGVSFCAGLAFYLSGAWPVVGFLGLDVLAIYWAFRASYRSGRQFETLELTDGALNVSRVSAAGKVQRWQFQTYWLRVEMDDPPRHASQLTLSSHGRRLVIGRFLPPAERLEVAIALRQALKRLRAPCFPQDA